MSGHSKWTQIKHKKAITDAKKGKLFSKVSREITVAAKSGGINPETNSRLRAAVERARSLEMPKDNIERAIQKTGGSGEETSLHEFIYEALGPGGAQIVIEGITDNKNRTLSEIKQILLARGAKLADQGSVLWNFEKAGVLKISESENSSKNRDEIETKIIDSGAGDFESESPDAGGNVVPEATGGVWLVYTSFSDLENVRKNLEKSGIRIQESGYEFIPKNKTEITPENEDALDKILEELSGQDDVQRVCANNR